MERILVILLLGVLVLSGCAHGKGVVSSAGPRAPVFAPQTGEKLILTPDTALVGKVVRVNAIGQFAVMVFPIGHLPTLEQRLSVYRLGLKTAEIKVTGPQLDDKIVGDIVAGDVQPGDEVRNR